MRLSASVCFGPVYRFAKNDGEGREAGHGGVEDLLPLGKARGARTLHVVLQCKDGFRNL